MNAIRLVFLLLLTASGAVAQDRLAVSSGLSGSGTVCDSYGCAPAPMSATRGNPLALTVAGSVGQPRALLLDVPPAICTAVPGIAGALAVRQPILLYLPLSWGRIYVTPGPQQSACSGWMGFGRLPFPTTVPAGFQVLVQTVSFTSAPIGVAPLAFSNAVEVTAL